jgi:hypothetical protein
MTRINPTKVWTNADGLQVRFNGEQGNHAWKWAVTREDGKIIEANMVVTLARLGLDGATFTADLNNDGTLDGFNTHDFKIPAGYVVESARVIVKEAGVGGTSIALQSYTEAGSVATANAYFTATQGANANLTLNSAVLGTGAGVGVRNATAVVPAIKALGTFTAGIVEVQLRLRDAR